jgi:hypothetical protein
MIHVRMAAMVMSVRHLVPAALLVISIAPVAWSGDGNGRRIRLGGISAGAGYSRGPAWWGPGWAPYGPAYWGSGFYRPYGPAWWDPWWYNGRAHPGFWNGFAQGPGSGEIKLNDAPKEAMVYLDGAFAGNVAKLKNIWLEPGAYNLEIRDDRGRSWEKRVYVLTGKTLALRPELREVSK